jgi:O-antigen ligase
MEARQLFYFTCGLAALFWLFERKETSRCVCVLLMLIVGYAAYRFFHTVIDANTLFPLSDSERVSISIAQRFFMGAILIGYLLTRREQIEIKWLLAALMVTILLIMIYVGYIGFVLEQNRGDRVQRATVFAYEIMAIYLVYLGLWLEREERNGWLHYFMFGVICSVVLYIVVWTETRAALICFFLGSLLLFLLSRHVNTYLFLIVGMIVSMVIVSLFFSETIKPRFLEARQDIVQYRSGENKETSLGIRFELWRSALMSFRQSPLLGSGYEKRSEIIEQAISEGKLDRSLSYYKTINIHNEFLEELSLRGLVGVALLAGLYGYLLWLALRQNRNLPLLGLILSYLFFGLTDVLFCSREATILFLVLLALVLSQPTYSSKMP